MTPGRTIPITLVAGLLLCGLATPGAAACRDAAAARAVRAAADAACADAGTGCVTARNHGAYVSCMKRQAKAAVRSGTLAAGCKGAVVSCAARSTCGRTGFVTCCRTNRAGKTSCSIKSAGGRCAAPHGGSACVDTFSSCCDACVGGACGGSSTSSTTVTTTSAPGSTTTTLAECGQATGNLVQNCGFETPAIAAGTYAAFGANDTSVTGWQVAASPAGGIDLTTATFFGGYPAHGGVQSLDLNHSDPGGIAQDLATSAGQTYRVTFQVSGFPASAANCAAADPKTLTVIAGGTSADFDFAPDAAATPPGNQPFAQKTMTFVAAGATTTLSFVSTTAGCAGPVIDDVVVVLAP